MTEIPSVSDELVLRYRTSYYFAEKVIRGSKWLWYAGLCAVLLQLALTGFLSLNMLNEFRAVEGPNGVSFSIRGQAVYMGVIYVAGIAIEVGWFYAGSLALAALGNSLKMQVDAAVNSSRDLQDDARTKLLLIKSRSKGRG